MKLVPDQHACTYNKCHLHIDAPRVKGEVMRNTPPAHFCHRVPLLTIGIGLELYSHHIFFTANPRDGRFFVHALCAVFIGAPSTLGGFLDPGAFNEVASGEQAANLSLGASLFNGTGAPTLFGHIQVDGKRTGDGVISVFDIAAALSCIPVNIQVAAVQWELRLSGMGELKLAARENRWVLVTLPKSSAQMERCVPPSGPRSGRLQRRGGLTPGADEAPARGAGSGNRKYCRSRASRSSLRSALAALGARCARRSLRSALAALGARCARRSPRSLRSPRSPRSLRSPRSPRSPRSLHSTHSTRSPSVRH